MTVTKSVEFFNQTMDIPEGLPDRSSFRIQRALVKKEKDSD